jgi:ferric enterobactin receptor
MRILCLKLAFLSFSVITNAQSPSTGTIEGDQNIRQQLNADTLPPKVSLTEIVVKGRKPPVSFKIDRQVFDASAYTAARQGTAIDLVRNLPSVSLNGQGELSMRGSSNFQVLINGRPTQGDPSFVLSQLPASQIDRVEIISSPGAAFDADGKSGVMNIITRTAPEQGLLLQSNLMGGLPSLQRFGNTRYDYPWRGAADLSLAWQKGGWELGGGVNLLRNDMSGYREGEVMTIFQGRRTDFPSNGERSFRRHNAGARMNLSFEPNTRNRFEAALYRGKRYQSRVADLDYENRKTILISSGPSSLFRYFNENTQDKEGVFTLASLGSTHRFGSNGTLSFNGQYEGANLTSLTTNRNLAARGSSVDYQSTNNPGSNPLDAWRLKSDYSHKQGERLWQAGYQFRYDRQDGSFSYQYRNLGDPAFKTDPAFSGDIFVQNRIHAGYLQHSAASGAWSWQAGLRVEHTLRDLKTSTDPVIRKLDLLNAFPSGQIRWRANEWNTLRAGYSRRVKRTNNFELNPIPEREHSETLEQGDPNLLPELTGQWELAWERRMQTGTFSASLYHQRILNPIQRVNSVFNDTILNRLFTNAASARQTGLEANLTLRAGSRWSGIFGGNIYRYDITGTLFGQPKATENNGWIYSINTTQTLNLKKGWMTQFSLSYLSIRATVQGQDGSFVVPNLTIRKTLPDNRWSFMAQWLYMDAGLGISNRQRISTTGADFRTTTLYIYEPDQIQLSATYQLSRKNRKINLPQSEMAEKEF